MKIFNQKSTTKNFQIGSPEAEAESTGKSKIKLCDVFEDYLEIIPELDYEKFIITGRKGSGKTAIGEHLYYLSTQKPNRFADFVRKEDIDIEKIIQLGKEVGVDIEQELLFKWIILIKFLKMLTQNESLQTINGMKDLQHFIKRNSGYVDIKNYEIIEIIKKEGVEIKIDNLKSFMAKYGKDFQFKLSKAPFFKLIPFLQEAILTVLKEDENENEYLLFFDDLDIGINLENQFNLQTLVNLIRIAKDINNNLFGKNSINAKVVILLRNDIARYLKKGNADTAKIFSSYEISLSWYEHELYRVNEDLLKLKKFIDKRIKWNFEKNKIEMKYPNNPWASLIEDDSTFYKESSFKYVIDHTFCKPRDLILFFKPLSEFEFKIPLQPQEINKLLGKYSSEAIDELTNEMLALLSLEEKNNILKSLRPFVNNFSISYDELYKELGKYKFSKPICDIIDLLFCYSIIGNKERKSSVVYFKHRETKDQDFRFNKDLDIVLHYILKIYLLNNNN